MAQRVPVLRRSGGMLFLGSGLLVTLVPSKMWSQYVRETPRSVRCHSREARPNDQKAIECKL